MGVKFKYNDGGRKKAGFKGFTGDCVVRALSIVTGRSYKETYTLMKELIKKKKNQNIKKAMFELVYM